MTDVVQIAIINTSGLIVVSILAAWVKKGVTKVDKNVIAVSKQIDGRMDELLELAKDKSREQGKKEGNIEGREELKNEQQNT